MDDNQLTVKKVSSKIGITLVLLLIVVYAVQYVVSYLLVNLIPNAVNQPWYIWSMTVISLYLVGFPIYLYIMKKIPDFKLSGEKKYSFVQMIMLVFICLAATYIFNFLSVGLNILIGQLKGSDVINPLEAAVNSSNVVYTFIVACVMAPIVEEIMFRKVMINKLVGYGENIAIVVSSFAFALFHGNLFQLLYAFVLGVIFAHITIKSGTIKYSLILHIIINTLGSVIIPFLALNSSEIMAVVLGLLIILIIFLGIILYIKNKKILFPSLNENPKFEGQEIAKVSNALLSKGMIAYLLMSTILITLSILA